ncbi:MAG: carbon-nitrogen hydrolase family protein [Paracoccaceae bacterium]|nr:carbon-nitrogen hydrolase family protein [Paracoccaceae bacterium]MDG2259877.1 carbon-nitrogen hydrolase family protein [Paracoccaceae bacterium]
MKTALIQLNSSDNPDDNLLQILGYLSEAVKSGAEFCLTPEVSNCVSTSREHQISVLKHEADDETLKAVRDFAAAHSVWVLIGSLALKTDDQDGRFANRSFLIDPTGAITAKYDKIHMFDVQVSPEETYHESAGYRPGTESILAQTPIGMIGLTVCYDVRFPHLYRDLAKAGAEILTVPSAFSPATGATHWAPLLKARAIENGCYVLAPAQTGKHVASKGKSRSTFGHSMVVDPWGSVVLDAGTEVGVHIIDLDLQSVSQTRKRVPSLMHDRDYTGPKGPE